VRRLREDVFEPIALKLPDCGGTLRTLGATEVMSDFHWPIKSPSSLDGEGFPFFFPTISSATIVVAADEQIRCEALMAGIKGKWDHSFDVSFSGPKMSHVAAATSF
jgi:hypothetical protein